MNYLSCMMGPVDSYARIVVFCIIFVMELCTNPTITCFVNFSVVFSLRGLFFFVLLGVLFHFLICCWRGIIKIKKRIKFVDAFHYHVVHITQINVH